MKLLLIFEYFNNFVIKLDKKILAKFQVLLKMKFF